MSGTDRPLVKPWWRRWPCKTAGAVFLAAGAWLLLTALFDGERRLRVEHDRITIGTVTRGTFHDFIPLRARIVPRETIYLDAIEGGRVEEVLAQAGDDVMAGQPLVRLSNTELELVVLDREARLIESITQLQARQSSLEQERLANAKQLAAIDYNIVTAQRSLTRRKALSSISQEDRDRLQDEIDYNQRLRPIQLESNERQEALRVHQLPQIAAQLEKLHADVEITRAKLASLLVRAPAAGRLTAMDLKIGESRNRGERLGELTPASGFKVVADVDEFYVGRIKPGSAATANIGDLDVPLRVERVYPQVRGGTITVDLNFSGNAPTTLAAGQAVQGRFSLGVASEATLLAAGPFLQETGGDFVFVVDPGGSSALKRRIHVGRRNSEQLEVLAGLAPGERVITSDYQGYGGIDRIDIH